MAAARPAVGDASPLEWGLEEIERGLDAGTLRVVDIVAACLDRVEARDGDIRSFSRLRDRREIIRDAAAADHDLRSGHRRSRLHGIPLSLKETLANDWRPDGPPPESRLLRRLIDSGAIMVGFTRATELAAQRTASRDAFVVNPVDPQVAVGGSSAGSAAAVAAGFCYLSIATDTGGSVRAPAAYCGVVGVKPTFGLVPLDTGVILSPRLDHLGLLTRTVRDSLLCLHALADDATATHEPRSIDGLRVGIDPTTVTTEMRAFVGNVAERLRALGGGVSEVRLPPAADIVAEYHLALNGEPPSPHLEGLRRAYRELFKTIDVLLGASVPTPMPLRSEYDRDRATEAFYTRRASSLLLNLVGAPGVVMPVRLGEGGFGSVQLSAAPDADYSLLALAARLE